MSTPLQIELSLRVPLIQLCPSLLFHAYTDEEYNFHRMTAFRQAMIQASNETTTPLTVVDSVGPFIEGTRVSWKEDGMVRNVWLTTRQPMGWPHTQVGGQLICRGSAGTVYLPHLRNTEESNDAHFPDFIELAMFAYIVSSAKYVTNDNRPFTTGLPLAG